MTRYSPSITLQSVCLAILALWAFSMLFIVLLGPALLDLLHTSP